MCVLLFAGEISLRCASQALRWRAVWTLSMREGEIMGVRHVLRAQGKGWVSVDACRAVFGFERDVKKRRREEKNPWRVDSGQCSRPQHLLSTHAKRCAQSLRRTTGERRKTKTHQCCFFLHSQGMCYYLCQGFGVANFLRAQSPRLRTESDLP